MQIPYRVFLIEKKHRFFRLLVPVVLLCSINSCSSSSGIDDYFTFNRKTSDVFLVANDAQIGKDDSDFILLPPDSSSLASNGTSLSLIQSVKLSRLALKDADTGYSISNVDTVQFRIAADSLPDLILATYSKVADSVFLTNADFAEYYKKSSVHFNIWFRVQKVPVAFDFVLFDFTLVYTARPKD